MFDLKQYLEHKRNYINHHLKEYIERWLSSSRMSESVEYCLMADGKRIRPILCLAACTALGKEPDRALPAACALEMIHTYSLIHDDLPALDNDDLRRGRPTCHVKFGEATAILTGDALLTMAFEVLCDTDTMGARLDDEIHLKVIGLIARAAGSRGMVEGQARDLAFEGYPLTQSQLEAMHALKTGALIRAAVVCGGLMGGAEPNQIDQLGVYADRIGLAFQVSDDILNVSGDPDLMGKAVGTDLARKKNTYPGLMGLEKSRKYARQLIDDALRSLLCFDDQADPLRAIATYVIERKR